MVAVFLSAIAIFTVLRVAEEGTDLCVTSSLSSRLVSFKFVASGFFLFFFKATGYSIATIMCEIQQKKS